MEIDGNDERQEIKEEFHRIENKNGVEDLLRIVRIEKRQSFEGCHSSNTDKKR